MLKFPGRCCVVYFVALLSATAQNQTNWPQFRGPNGDGVAETGRLPVRFGEGENVTWKTALHGRAWSSPVIWGTQIWLTTANKDAKELSVLCVDKDSGKIVRDEKLFVVEKPQYVHPFNSAASP